MSENVMEYAVIKSAVRILCAVCSAPESMVINALTGLLWDEEEAGEIKRSSGRCDLFEQPKEQEE